MIDLHMHTFFSDGCLCPAELIQRVTHLGHQAVALTDHVDPSNLDLVLPRIRQALEQMGPHLGLTVLPGVELTHCPPALIAPLAQQARRLGAKVVVVHGETMVEPVPAGTNRAAIEAGVDILAHPGLLREEDAALAAQKGVHLEITARKGHSLGNGRVAALARKHGAKLVINTDSHAPGDLIDRAFARQVALGAGLDEAEVEACFANSARLVRRAQSLEA